MLEGNRDQERIDRRVDRLTKLRNEIKTGRVGELEVDPRIVVKELSTLEEAWVHDLGVAVPIGQLRNTILVINGNDFLETKELPYRGWNNHLINLLMRKPSGYFSDNRAACEAYLRAVARMTYGLV